MPTRNVLADTETVDSAVTVASPRVRDFRVLIIIFSAMFLQWQELLPNYTVFSEHLSFVMGLI